MPALPTIPTFTDGPSSSSQMNQLAAALAFMYLRPRFKLRQATTQSFANNTDVAVQFDAHVLDTDVDGQAGHSDSSNNTRWTCRYPGWYLISGTVTFNANATGIRWAFLTVNGVPQDASTGTSPGTAAEVLAVHCHTTKIYMAQGDYVELWGRQSSGGALGTYVASSPFQSAMDGHFVSSA